MITQDYEIRGLSFGVTSLRRWFVGGKGVIEGDGIEALESNRQALEEKAHGLSESVVS